MWHGYDKMAHRQTFHLLAHVSTWEQDLWRQAAQYENTPLRQSGGETAPHLCGQCWQDADGAGGLLSAPRCPCGQRQGGDRHGAQTGGALLQHAAVRHGLPGPGSGVL